MLVREPEIDKRHAESDHDSRDSRHPAHNECQSFVRSLHCSTPGYPVAGGTDQKNLNLLIRCLSCSSILFFSCILLMTKIYQIQMSIGSVIVIPIPYVISPLFHHPDGAVPGLTNQLARGAAEEELFGLGVVVPADDNGAAGQAAPGLEDGLGHGLSLSHVRDRDDLVLGKARLDEDPTIILKHLTDLPLLFFDPGGPLFFFFEKILFRLRDDAQEGHPESGKPSQEVRHIEHGALRAFGLVHGYEEMLVFDFGCCLGFHVGASFWKVNRWLFIKG